MIKIHVLNVGHGDCILVEHPSGRLSIIDINCTSEMDQDSRSELLEHYRNQHVFGASNIVTSMFPGSVAKEQSLLKTAGYDVALTEPIAYLKGMSLTETPWRFISTHPHMDHLSGLSALRDEIGFQHAWILPNTFTQNKQSPSETQKQDWALYERLRAGEGTGVTTITPREGDQNNFWQQDGIHILGPTNALLNSATNPNDISYVLLIKYGTTKIVLGGDAEKSTWKHITETYPDAIRNVTLLKASHHGRDSGYYQPAVSLMKPRVTVVSVGKKPSTDASKNYDYYSGMVMSTRWWGNIRYELDAMGGGNYYPEHNRDKDAAA